MGRDWVKSRLAVFLLGAAVMALLAVLWGKTRSLDPKEHQRVDSALRELRSLDRTINQDVLRARYKLIDGYDPVRKSYRQIELVEGQLANPPGFLDAAARAAFLRSVESYSAAVTAKQRLIEVFKYRSADLTEVLAYLPGAGAGLASAAAEQGDERLAAQVHRVLEQALVYSLTSEEERASALRASLDALALAGEASSTPVVRWRARAFVTSARSLVGLKHAVDAQIRGIFEEPVVAEEEEIASVYYAGYASAERRAAWYRMGLYGLCVLLAAGVVQAGRWLKHTADDLAATNERLEQRVLERTRELDVRNRELRAVLDNVNQALFTVGLDGRLSAERSAMLERWFPEAKPGADLGTIVEAVDAAAGASLRMAWHQLREATLPFDEALEPLPRTLSRAGWHYQIGYRPIAAEDRIEKVLLVISDVTEAVARERREIEQKERLAVFQRITQDREGFADFVTEGERLVRVATAPALGVDRASVLRALHTLKGTCGMFGLTSIAAVCHELESEVVGSPRGLSEDESARLASTWASFAAKHAEMMGIGARERDELSAADLEPLRLAIAAGKKPAELLRLIARMSREPAERRLARLADHGLVLARRLGKGAIAVTNDAGGVRVCGRRWAPFWSACVHLLRNAIDHGLESPEERVASGKPAAGRITLRVRETDDQVVFEVADDGGGIDWDTLREKAVQRGLPAATEADLVRLLLQGGVSTKATVSEVSGGGVGVMACYQACIELGGNVEIESRRGLGTTFRFRIPSDDAVGATVTSAA